MRKIRTLISAMVKIGLIGFGGGNALIPVIEKSIVEEEKLITKSEYEENVMIASITPGALPVEIAGGIGKQIAGIKGMIAGAVAMAAPGAVLTLLLLSAMSQLNMEVLQQIQYVAVGITAFISCLLTDYIVGTYKVCSQRGDTLKCCMIIAAVFILTGGKNFFRIMEMDRTPFFGLATIDVFVMAFFAIFYTNCRFTIINVTVTGILCFLYILDVGKSQLIQNGIVDISIKLSMFILAVYGAKKNFDHELKDNKIPVTEIIRELGILAFGVAVTLFAAMLITDKSLVYVGNGFLSSIMSFGGGDAYLTVADGLFVHTGLVSENEFYSCIVPTVNILPGSILCKTLSGIGYYIGYGQFGNVWGGVIVALAGFVTSVAASCGVFIIIGDVYGSFEKLEVFQIVKRWIRPSYIIR